MTSVSISLSEVAATVECRSCEQNVDLHTDDRDALVRGMRAFLDVHTHCADGLRGG
jgi:hypothetical protein